ncbi:MAG: outer membrane beta-barrel protein [Bacteroides sp.]|nr:outer membrane beta-barrel protein [Bacteroides sp.]
MKKKYIHVKLMVILIMCLAMSSQGGAQTIPNGYVNVDWQLNSPLSNDFVNKMSGWGLHAEAGYYVWPTFSVGGFVSFHTNNKFVDRTTIQISETSAINTDQQHSIFQVPFGATMRYVFNRERWSYFEPYIGSKIGAAYSEVSSYMNIFKAYERKWGFYISPEVGVTVFATPMKTFGIHVAAYYSLSTNKSHVVGYSVDGLNNWGFRLGIAF